MNTLLIAERCNVTIPSGKTTCRSSPSRGLPSTTTSNVVRQYAHAWSARDRPEGEAAPLAHDDRLHEIAMVKKMGYPGYLIVWDFIRYAREKGIPVVRRGLAAGSLAAWALRSPTSTRFTMT
jgi:DNA polymerase-3 subunit alpha